MKTWKEILDHSERSCFNYAKFDSIIDSTFVTNLRKKLDMNQLLFANLIGVDQRTVEGWESRKEDCQGTASRLLYLLDQNPELIQELMAYEDVKTGKKVQEKIWKEIEEQIREEQKEKQNELEDVQ